MANIHILFINIVCIIIETVNYSIRSITKDELTIPLEWAAKEGWNPGLSDADAFYAVDPKGFFMGFLGDEPVASLSAVSYGPDFGFLGFYIVKPEHRGKRYGWKLWQEALKHLPTQNIGLDGVLAQQENYKKSGFKLAYRNTRYEGKGLQQVVDDPHIKSLDQIPLNQILSYDLPIFLYPRKTFLSRWIKQPNSLAIGYIEKNLKGYGVIRPCHTGFKIGPLFADTTKIADELLKRLLAFAGPESQVFFDIPEVNKEAVNLAESHNMKPMFETARMYTKEFPPAPLHKIFGITTFEVG